LVFVLVARVAVFQFAPSPPMIVTIANVLFGLVGAAVFIHWIHVGWIVEHWMVVPRAALIVTGLFIAISQCSGGTFWLVKGGVAPEPLEAAGVLLGLLLAAASPICRFSMNQVLKFMDHPFAIFRKKEEV
jgi:hypothetical protein